MDKDGVNEAFELIIAEIDSVTKSLNRDGAVAFEESRYAEAQRLGEAGNALNAFRLKLEALQSEWNTEIDVQTRQRITVVSGHRVKDTSTRTHSKGPKTSLRVTLADGKVIQRQKASETMAEAVESLGLERIMALNLRVSGVPLVCSEKHPEYGQVPVQGYYVCTHANNEAKKRTLETVARKLGVRLRVEIIKP